MKLATLQAQLPDFEIRLLTLADQEALLKLEQSNPRYHQYFSPEPLTMTEVQHDLTAHPDELAALQANITAIQLTRVTADEGVARFWQKLGFEDGNQLFLPLKAGGRLAVTTMTRLLQ
ncbi:hypothetical protein AB9X87_01510 [Lactiplantibacillus plantarum]|uniref:hypothetical protein n=1 Tax=Lactiplantibacillus plantarum TaxID=1590 RepID=UPI0035231D8B